MGLKLFFPHVNFELHVYLMAVIGVVNESQLRIRTNDHINCMYIGLGVGDLVDLY